MVAGSLVSSLPRKALWTIGTYGASLTLRLGSNVVLARLLAPEILGIMVLINSIRVGIELLTDVGIEQNIVVNKRGLESAFFNTAWTMQIIRGAFLTGIFLFLTPYFSSLYAIDHHVFLIISFAPFINSLASTSIFVLSRNIKVKERNLFELCVEAIGMITTVIFVLISPTASALATGVLAVLVIRAAMSYFLAHPPHRLMLKWSHVSEIFSFGKWIMLSSLIIYASTNFDRLYLGQVIPLGIIGVYGLARTIAELPPLLASRLSYQLMFPVIASIQSENTSVQRTRLAMTRRYFVMAGCVVVATAAAWSDFAINLLYDNRYAAAGWMLCGLLICSWLAILSSLNEAVLLGMGKPINSSISNASRLIVLALGLPFGYQTLGLLGAVVAVGLSELARYISVAIGQHNAAHSFWKQDCASTFFFSTTFTAWLFVRNRLNLGFPWSGMNIT